MESNFLWRCFALIFFFSRNEWSLFKPWSIFLSASQDSFSIVVNRWHAFRGIRFFVYQDLLKPIDRASQLLCAFRAFSSFFIRISYFMSHSIIFLWNYGKLRKCLTWHTELYQWHSQFASYYFCSFILIELNR